LSVLQNKILRRIFGPKRKEITGQWRKLYNEELHNLDSLPNIRAINSKRMRLAVHTTHIGKMRNVHKILV
jgi:hypothetical protein